jgi:hypothetical protein
MIYILDRRDFTALEAAIEEHKEIVESLKALANKPVALSPREMKLIEGGVREERQVLVPLTGVGREGNGRSSRPLQTEE